MEKNKKHLFLIFIVIVVFFVGCNVGVQTHWFANKANITIQIPSALRSGLEGSSKTRAVVLGESYLYVFTTEKGTGNTRLFGPEIITNGKVSFLIEPGLYSYFGIINTAEKSPEFEEYFHFLQNARIQQSTDIEDLIPYLYSYFPSAASLAILENKVIVEGPNSISAKLIPLVYPYNGYVLDFYTNSIALSPDTESKSFYKITNQIVDAYLRWYQDENTEIALYDSEGKKLETEQIDGVYFTKEKINEYDWLYLYFDQSSPSQMSFSFVPEKPQNPVAAN